MRPVANSACTTSKGGLVSELTPAKMTATMGDLSRENGFWHTSESGCADSREAESRT